MRRFRRSLTIGMLILLLAAALIGVSAYQSLYRPVKLKQPVSIIILPKATFSYVAGRLQARGLIPSAFYFKVYARLKGKARKVRVGEYEITNGQRPIDILDMLASGRMKAYRVTVPEGKWSSEIEKLITERFPDAKLDALITNVDYWRSQVKFPLEGHSLEGFLFPDTYFFPKGMTAEQIIGKMLERFQVTNYAAYLADPPEDGRSLYQVLTLASLVEAEAKRPEERPIIAGVYMNRLHKHILLQCDSTVLYAHKQRMKRVWDKDLAIDSPYNTYRYLGLPAGPICNPGLASFNAALHPAKVDYLYYVARGDGSHIFTRTLDEHESAKMQVQGK